MLKSLHCEELNHCNALTDWCTDATQLTLFFILELTDFRLNVMRKRAKESNADTVLKVEVISGGDEQFLVMRRPDVK